MIDITEARRLWAATTPGEWTTEYPSSNTVWVPDGPTVLRSFTEQYVGNSAWSAWSHNNMPALLDELETLRRVNTELNRGLANAMCR